MTKHKICPTCGASYDAANLFCPRDSTPLRSVGEVGELVGSLIAGRYLVSTRIGVGGMGEVYRAQDVRLQRPVAIKVLHASLSTDVDALARFSREAANCSKINSQYVVHVHDFGETEEGLAYLAMEFVEGRSLKVVIDTEGPLAPERVARIVAQIAKGLDAAHRLDCPVVHRDLKPENVLVTDDPEGGELVKVADFGISKALRDETQQVTRTGFVTGTYEYMSPEQVSAGVVDQRSDVYSLGLITFLMLTGKLPFPAETPEHSMLLRLTETPRTLRAIRPEIGWPEALQRTIDQALARDPGQRYDSAGAFARDLFRSIQAEQQPEVSGGTRSKRRGVWVATAVGLLALIVGVVILVNNWPVPRETAFVPSPADTLVSLNPEPARNDRPVRPDSTMSPSEAPKSTSSLAEPRLETVPQPREPKKMEPTTPKPTRPTSSTAKPRTPPHPTADQARPALDSYEVLLHPDLPRDSALLAVASLNALLPRLTTARDSVEADIYRAEATALAGEPKDACAILEHARPRATQLQRRKIELWTDQGICTDTDWRAS